MVTLKEKLYQSIDLLPEKDISLVYEVVERLLVTFDKDYTYVTRAEDERIQQGLAELQAGGGMNIDDFIQQNNLAVD